MEDILNFNYVKLLLYVVFDFFLFCKIKNFLRILKWILFIILYNYVGVKMFSFYLIFLI